MIGTRERAAQLAAEVATVAVGKCEVEQDEVGRLAGEARPRLGHRARGDDVEALAEQGAPERVGDRRLVLHEQDACSTTHGPLDCRPAATAPQRGLCRSFAWGFHGLWRGGATMTTAPLPTRGIAMRTATTTVAAARLLAIGGAAGAALSARPDRAPAPAAVVPAPVEVRTQVIHRTVHVVRHIKPKRVKRAAPPAPAPAPRCCRPAPSRRSPRWRRARRDRCAPARARPERPPAVSASTRMSRRWRR